MTIVDRTTVRATYRAGVDAVGRVAGSIDGEQWDLPACGHWTAADTVRHLATVAAWYHAWLDRALVGDATPPFPLSEMDRETARALADAGPIDPEEALARFVDEAGRYEARVDDETWDTPFGYPRGTVTAGLHLGIAAVEWHVHAWDLSGVTSTHHVPDDVPGLYLGAAACNAATAGPWRAAAMRRAAVTMAPRAPWEALLRRTGRLKPEATPGGFLRRRR